jgi:hypothetical protein
VRPRAPVRNVEPVIRTCWTSTPAALEPERDCTVIAAHLPLNGAGELPCALAHPYRLVRVLRSTDGLLGHALAVQLAPPALWTVSAWADRTPWPSSNAHPRTARRKHSSATDCGPPPWPCGTAAPTASHPAGPKPAVGSAGRRPTGSTTPDVTTEPIRTETSP